MPDKVSGLWSQLWYIKVRNGEGWTTFGTKEQIYFPLAWEGNVLFSKVSFHIIDFIIPCRVAQPVRNRDSACLFIMIMSCRCLIVRSSSFALGVYDILSNWSCQLHDPCRISSLFEKKGIAMVWSYKTSGWGGHSWNGNGKFFTSSLKISATFSTFPFKLIKNQLLSSSSIGIDLQ